MAASSSRPASPSMTFAPSAREPTVRCERDIGTALQQQPFASPPPTLSGYDLACYNEPAQDVDGDFHTFTRFGPASFEVLAGDVMGKGLGAARIGLGINSTYRRILAEMLAAHPAAAPAPAALINAIHAALAPQLIDAGTFVTLVLLRFDREAQTVTWVNAGHTPSLLLPAGGSEVHELLGDNLPLGVLASESYCQHVAPFAAGDTLLLYSDGLSEALDTGRLEYGAKRIKEMLVRACPAAPAAILEQLQRDLQDYMGSAKAADDRSAIVIRAKAMSNHGF